MSTGREDSAKHLFYTKPAEVQAKEAFALDVTKHSKKNFISYPSNKYEDSFKQHINTLPAWIIQDFSMYASYQSLPKYQQLFFSHDEKYAYRNGVILERDGEWFPSVAGDIPTPEQPITTPKAFYPSVYSEKHGEETIWIRSIIDYHQFDYAERYYEIQHFTRFIVQIALKVANSENRFVSSLINAWIYGVTSRAVLFEKSSDDQIFWQPTGKDIKPEENFSKLAAQYYKTDGEIFKQLKKMVGWALDKHKNRVMYDPLHNPNPMHALSKDRKDAEFNEEFNEEFKIPDLSDNSKVKEYIKKTYYEKYENDSVKPLQLSRGHAVAALANTILATVERFTSYTPLQTNTFAYLPGESAKDESKAKLADVQKTRCNPKDLIVLMNPQDRKYADRITVGTTNPIYPSGDSISGIMKEIRDSGVSLADCPVLLPGWAIVCDRRAFHVYRYYHAIFRQHHPYQLIESHIGHSMFRPVMFSQVCGAAILPVTEKSFTADSTFYDWEKTYKLLKDN